MSREEVIGDILLNWEELREQGHEPVLDELCRDHPEVRGEVERRIQALRKMYQIPNAAEAPTQGLAQPPVPVERSAPALADYEILELLGSGGMGKVFKVRQRSLKRLVALKMILAGYAASAAEIERFRIEAEAAAALQHPHIVQIYEIGQADGCPYLTLEYVAGGSLAERLQAGPLPPRQAAELVRTVARAMHYAHQHGIIHRDLKPANILLAPKSEIRNPKSEKKQQPGDSPAKSEDLSFSDFGFRISDFEPKVTDFGLAKRLDDLSQTRSGSVLGTPSYMAPEQAEGHSRQIGPRSDIYSLGAILYECLTGQPPFEAPTLLEILELVRSQDPLPPRRQHPDVPVDLETICLKCLQKDPVRRYASAEELADDLTRFLDSEPIRARNPSLMDRVAWTLNRSRSLPDVQPSFAVIGLIGPSIFLIQLATFAIAYGRPEYPWIAFVVTLLTVFSIITIYFVLSGEGVRIPLNTTTRHLWSVRVAQLLGLAVLPVVSWLLQPAGSSWNPLTVFPLWAVVSGVNFFALGGIYWGRFYLLGLAFLATAMLMPLWLDLAPLTFSFLVGLTLTLAIRHVRRWREAQEAAPGR